MPPSHVQGGVAPRVENGMDPETMLQQSNAVEAIARELGVDRQTAQRGAEALLPSLLSGFQAPAAAGGAQAFGGIGGGGLGGLLGTIAGLGGGSLLDDVTSPQPTQVGKGNEILGQVFGSKDQSRAVATQAAARSGIEPSLLKKMLPILAMVVAGYVMKQAGHGGSAGGGGLGGGLGGVLGSVLGQGSGGGAAAGSGNILGDLIGAAGKILGR